MVAMNGNRYKLLGFVVWQGGRWYLRRRLPSARRVALTGAATATALLGGAVLLKRLSG
jgi:hypothetical protein